jgi:hypothetical protein
LLKAVVQPYLKTRLQVRGIPHAFLSPDSATKPAWVLTSKNASAALNKGEAGWKKGVVDGGGDFSEVKATPAIAAQLEANKALFRKLGMDATPRFVHKDAKGVVRTITGIASQHTITTMTGLPFHPDDRPGFNEYSRGLTQQPDRYVSLASAISVDMPLNQEILRFDYRRHHC